MHTHMNEQSGIILIMCRLSLSTVNIWQVSHILRQHVAVRFREWNMMKVEEYLSRG